MTMSKVLRGVVFLALLVAVMLYATGVFRGEGVGGALTDPPPGVGAPAASAVVAPVQVPVYEEAVGTVDTRTRVAVAAQVTARVLSVAGEAGSHVHPEDEPPLVVLDDRELAARLAQAEENLAAAEAARDQAEQARIERSEALNLATSRYDRVKRYREGNAATEEQLDEAQAGFLQAKAALAAAEASVTAAGAKVKQAGQVVEEARVAVGHARIRAPFDGVVAERRVEPGDLAWPGRTLLVVLDPRALRLEAQVREGLIARIRTGDRLEVSIPAARRTVPGRVAEVVPSADPTSRTFQVRVDFEPPEGVYPGMFGRLRIPVGSREVIRIPDGAVARVGQLETVLVRDADGGRWSRRTVTTGAALEDGYVEVLSGLGAGEEVGLGPEAPR